MMAMLLANQIILGQFTFDRVPASLKPAVKKILVDAGVPELAEETPATEG